MQPKLAKSGILLSIMLLTAASIVPSAFGHSGGMMTSYMMQNSVSVDGTCGSPQEWSDSMGMGMEMIGGGMMGQQQNSEVRVKHDRDSVYVMVEAVGDASPSMGDMAWIAFDTSHDGGNEPGNDDHAFAMHWTSAEAYNMTMHQGNGAAWGPEMQPPGGMQGASGMSSANCPQGASHVMYEMKIPRSALGQSTSMGMMSYAFDSATNASMRWPAGEGLENMNQMGDMSFSDRSMAGTGPPIPGFPAESILLGLAIGLFAALVLRKRATRDSHLKQS